MPETEDHYDLEMASASGSVAAGGTAIRAGRARSHSEDGHSTVTSPSDYESDTNRKSSPHKSEAMNVRNVYSIETDDETTDEESSNR